METPAADRKVLTVVTAAVPPGRESDLISGYREMTSATWPDGLIRTELLRGQQGAWRIQSLWRDLRTLQTLRTSGQRPAAAALLDRIGAEHSHEVYFVEDAHSQDG